MYRRLKKIFEIFPFFLLMIPLFLIVHIERQYRHLIVYKFVSNEISELFAASLISTGIFFVFVRNFRRSAVFALPVVLTFYFFCDLKDFLNSWNSKSFFSSYAFLLPALTVILLAVFFSIKKSKSDFKRLFRYTNILFLILIFYELGAMRREGDSKKAENDNQIVEGEYSPCDSCARPDIYYIVFDAYTSSRVLQSEFDYQNSKLDSLLAQKKFFSIKKSRSNYNLTPFSIGSTLNLNYLYSLDTKKDFFLNEYLPGVGTVFNSEVIQMFKKEGYTIFNHSIFDFAGIPSTIPHFDLWELNMVYRRHNILKKMDDDVGWLIRRTLHLPVKSSDNTVDYVIQRDKHVVKTVKAMFETIEKEKSPAFVYGHILLPHSPYSYDSSGNKLRQNGPPLSREQTKAAYVQQVVYVNRLIDKLVGSILSKARNNVVIILQGDHGPRFTEVNKRNLEFANLNAMYFYNKDYRMLHDSLSNVNTFRVVFNTFFGQNYPLLKDTSYFLQYK
jgi:hypothetical protein